MDYEEKLLNELTHIKHREELNSGQHTYFFKH
jgi:hemolysin-activating ACP:hemolysin acyltransferase